MNHLNQIRWSQSLVNSHHSRRHQNKSVARWFRPAHNDDTYSLFDLRLEEIIILISAVSEQEDSFVRLRIGEPRMVQNIFMLILTWRQ